MNHLWGYLIVEELVRNGIDYFVISPGSRSTPLTITVAEHAQARKMICLDERGAAFHAVGYARATGQPAVLICTSGSAAANYFPAVIEAATDGVPLIILSADRPPELRQTGANQTIEQVDLYGTYPVWKFDLPCPTVEINPSMVLTTIDLAVYRSRRSSGGVVHLNLMFREPLAPTGEPVKIPASLAKWQQQQLPYTSYSSSFTIPDCREIQSLLQTIIHTDKGVLVVGQLKSEPEILAVSQLAARLNWVVFADIQSGLRSRGDLPNLVDYFDQLLLTDAAVELEQIETVIQIGTRIVSARWLKWLEKYPPHNYIAIVNDGERHDPTHLVSLRLESDITYLCDRLCEQLPQFIGDRSRWVNQLCANSRNIGLTADRFLKTTTELTEPLVAQTISQLIPNHHGLWVANSMPIRDLDMYATPLARVGANRGTSGIEGSIASATGFAVGLQAPVTAIVGDLASLHDLNSLALLSHIAQPVILVIINNNGGGIFSFLPIAKSTTVFDTYFGTPHGLDFAHAAAMFAITYYHPQSPAELIQNYTQALADGQNAIIEVTTDRHDNWQLHQTLQHTIQQQFNNQ